MVGSIGIVFQELWEQLDIFDEDVLKNATL